MAAVRIDELRLFRYSLPFRQPMVLKGIAVSVREGLLLRMADTDGHEGWGEIAPLPGFSEETLEQATGEITGLRSACVGGWFDPGELLPKKIARHSLLPSVQCGLEIAMLNLGAACRGVTVARLLDPQSRSRVMVNALLTGTGAELVAHARARVADKYSSLKLKVGRQSVDDDIAAVRRVREAIGNDIELRLDANRAWSLEDASRFAVGIRECRVAYVEEPLAAPADLPILCRDTGLAIALDETMTVLDPGGVPLFPGFKAIVLKPTILGGFGRCRQFAREALDDGLLPVISSSFESGIGISALANLAAAAMPEGTACGLDTLDAMHRDLLTLSPAPQHGSIDLQQSAQYVQSVDLSQLEEIPGA